MHFCALLDGHKLAQTFVQRNQHDDIAINFREFASGPGSNAIHRNSYRGNARFVALRGLMVDFTCTRTTCGPEKATRSMRLTPAKTTSQRSACLDCMTDAAKNSAAFPVFSPEIGTTPYRLVFQQKIAYIPSRR